MTDSFFSTPLEAAAAGSSPQFFRVLAVAVDGSVAAIGVQENDAQNPMYALTICARTPRGWEVISESGGSGTEMSVWTLGGDLDEGEPEEVPLGVGAYFKQLDDRATQAKVAIARTVKTVTPTDGWIVLVNGAIAEADWNPHTVEVEIEGRWTLPSMSDR